VVSSSGSGRGGAFAPGPFWFLIDLDRGGRLASFLRSEDEINTALPA
jgi:hypothetical protein